MPMISFLAISTYIFLAWCMTVFPGARGYFPAVNLTSLSRWDSAHDSVQSGKLCQRSRGLYFATLLLFLFGNLSSENYSYVIGNYVKSLAICYTKININGNT